MITTKPPQSFIEQLPAGFKLGALCFLSIAIFFISNPFFMAALLIAVIGLFLIAKFSFYDILKIFKPLWWIILIVVCFQFFVSPSEAAFIVVLRLIIFIMLASLVTMTTSTAHMLETFEWLFQPLKYIGISPAKVSLALSLTLRFIPLFRAILHDVQEAQKTRGLEKNIIALVIPVAVRMFKMSDDVSDAIEARSYDSNTK